MCIVQTKKQHGTFLTLVITERIEMVVLLIFTINDFFYNGYFIKNITSRVDWY